MSENKPPSLMSQVHMRPADRGVRKFWVLLIAGISLALLMLAGILFWHSQSQLNQIRAELQKKESDPADQLQEENKQLIMKVGKLIILPSDEDPTIATVSDLNKLQNQPFFAKAQLGDKVLIYTKAKKAILYRPSSNQIIELAPLVNDEPAPETPAQ